VYREVYEESGVKVYNVKYHSAQPWPYPGNLMVGFYARADSTKPISLVDSELAGTPPFYYLANSLPIFFPSDAKWYTRAEILKVLEHPDGTNISGRDVKRLDEIVSGQKPDSFASQLATTQDLGKDENAPAFRVPPRGSIAGVLISDWAYGKSKL
jgi:NAD+ diphosphatase